MQYLIVQTSLHFILREPFENQKRQFACASSALGDLNLGANLERATIILRPGG